MDNPWRLEIRIDEMAKADAERLYEILLRFADFFPGSSFAGYVGPAADWPQERAAILEAVEAVDDEP